MGGKYHNATNPGYEESKKGQFIWELFLTGWYASTALSSMQEPNLDFQNNTYFFAYQEIITC